MKNLRIFTVLPIAVCMVFLSGCKKKKDQQPVEGYKPIYMSQDDMQRISGESPINVVNPGKIYMQGNMLYINEVGEGVHIFDNTDPENPKNIGFVRVPGNYDMSVKGNILYVDNVTDLVAVDISDPQAIQVKSRVENVFPVKKFPEETGVQFECVDDSKGIVIGWEKTMLDNPKCYR